MTLLPSEIGRTILTKISILFEDSLENSEESELHDVQREREKESARTHNYIAKCHLLCQNTFMASNRKIIRIKESCKSNYKIIIKC